MPDFERQALSNKLLFAERPERELTKEERKHDEEIAERRARNAPRSKARLYRELTGHDWT
jgi:hypothetical protein